MNNKSNVSKQGVRMSRSFWIGCLSFVVVAACSSDPAGVTDSDIAGPELPGGDADVVELDDVLDVDAGDPACWGKPDGLACDDGDLCTLDDVCQSGHCVGSQNDPCDAEGPCRIGYCDSAQGCIYGDAANNAPCSVACFGAASCVAGACEPDADSGTQCPEPEEPCVDQLGCDQSTGECTVEIYKSADTDCDTDDNACSFETCDGDGACLATGVVETCEDENVNNPCWTWTCTPKTGCIQTAFVLGASCNDGNPCTYSDTCTENEFGQELCIGAPLPMDDDNVCTDDKCIDGAITHTSLPGIACEPDDPCSATGACDIGGSCVPADPCPCYADEDCPQPEDACAGLSFCDLSDDEPACAIVPDSPVVCMGEAEPCHDLVCDPATGTCEETLSVEGSSCDDGSACSEISICLEGACVADTLVACDDDLFCNGAETCDAVLGCQPGLEPEADDKVACTIDLCDEDLDKVVYTANGGLCDDDSLCNGVETCDAIEGCLPGTPIDCSGFAGTCVQTVCNEITGACDLLDTPGTACDDGDDGTSNDICDADGECAGSIIECDADPCIESATPDGEACIYVWKGSGTECDDGAITTNLDQCPGDGECQGTPYDCTPLICEAESSHNGEGCTVTYEPLGTDCDDADLATVDDVCDGQGSCAGVAPTCGDEAIEGLEACDDGNAETEACAYGQQACTVCSAACELVDGDVTGYCGDGVIDAAHGESCDDENEVDGDGCSSACVPDLCQPGWSTHDGSCYQKFFDPLRTWADAEADCVTRGGHLISVKDAAEDLLMTQLYEAHPFGSADIWFGFNDIETEGVWAWSDGSPITYTSWQFGPPPTNSQQNANDCGNLNSNTQWWTNNCQLEKLYICECMVSNCLANP
jgi:cysteine-rich repeat protein